MTPLKTRQAALAAAALSVVGSAVYFGAFGLPRLPAGRADNLLGLLAALAAAIALGLAHNLARKRSLRLSEPLRKAVELGLSGLVFLFVLYHLSHTLSFAGPVALAIDALVPAPVLHILALLPGLIAAALTEAVWRRPLAGSRE
jgi:membrane protease YdiL (CAAX protease family)